MQTIMQEEPFSPAKFPKRLKPIEKTPKNTPAKVAPQNTLSKSKRPSKIAISKAMSSPLAEHELGYEASRSASSIQTQSKLQVAMGSLCLEQHQRTGVSGTTLEQMRQALAKQCHQIETLFGLKIQIDQIQQSNSREDLREPVSATRSQKRKKISESERRKITAKSLVEASTSNTTSSSTRDNFDRTPENHPEPEQMVQSKWQQDEGYLQVYPSNIVEDSGDYMFEGQHHHVPSDPLFDMLLNSTRQEDFF